MNTAQHHQSKLYEALGYAIEDREAPAFMTPTKEAIALAVMARQVVELLTSGTCPLTKLMALSQQALRCAALACAQGDESMASVNAAGSQAAS